MREKKVPRTDLQVWAGYLAVCDPSCVRPQVGENVYETLIVGEASYRNVFIHSYTTPTGAKCVHFRFVQGGYIYAFFSLSEICGHKVQLKMNLQRCVTVWTSN